MKIKNFLFAVTSSLLLCSCASIDKSAIKAEEEPFDLFPGEDTIPIMSWYSIPPDDLSVERFIELKEAGFNLNFSHMYGLAEAKKALDCAQQAGIRNLFMCGALIGKPEEIVPQVMNHPGLAGYHLQDEPQKVHIPVLAEANKKIRAIDPNHFTYLNLYPVGATDPFMPYIDYIHYCAKEVPTPFISYDHYGIVNNEIRGNYYQNLEIISKEARKLGKPFWAFALSTAHGSYPVPNVAQLKLQMYSNLAYGAQGLQYFTYWNPGTETWNFHDAPITLEKKRSSVYDYVREVNAELQKRNFVFMRSKVEFVRHTGEKLPLGTKRLETLPDMVTKLDTHGKDAVVSLLTKNDMAYLVIVNAGIHDDMSLTITFKSGVTRIRKDGTSVAADKYVDTLLVGPGECEVFAWKK
ncbi:MAG: beta-galactosidase [Victivallales bacterium]|nr:beta-galactosidase [Victivallales bacterium]